MTHPYLTCVMVFALALSASIALAQSGSTTPAPKPNAETSRSEVSASGSTPLTAQEQQFLAVHGRRIAEFYAFINGRFYACPTWDRRYPSSAHQTVERWTIENTEKERVTLGYGLAKTVSTRPSRAEALAAATSLPALSAGAYGHIHSAKVVTVLGPTEMIVTDIWLVDEEEIRREREKDEKLGEKIIERIQEEERLARGSERRDQSRTTTGSRSGNDREDGNRRSAPNSAEIRQIIDARYKQRDEIIKRHGELRGKMVRVIGFSTAAAPPGRRWTPVKGEFGPQVVIADEPAGAVVEVAKKGGGSRGPVAVVLNAQAFHTPLPETQLNGLIASAGMTPREFIETARGLMSEQRGDALPVIVATLENARANRAAAEAAAASKGTAAGADKSAGGGKSDWFQQKYGDKKTGPDDAAADPDKPAAASSSNWLKEKYDKDKSATVGSAKDGAKPADAPADDTPQWLKDKYSKYRKDAPPPAAAPDKK